MPTDRELQRELRDAPWSREIQKGDKHHLARYRYEEPLSKLNTIPERVQVGNDGPGEQ